MYTALNIWAKMFDIAFGHEKKLTPGKPHFKMTKKGFKLNHHLVAEVEFEAFVA